MVRLAQRGNEVGFSGGNVMRMDVTYFDLSGRQRRQYRHDRRPARATRRRAPTRARTLPRNQLERRDVRRLPSPPGPTAAHHAHALCRSTAARCCGPPRHRASTQADNAEQAGIRP